MAGLLVFDEEVFVGRDSSVEWTKVESLVHSYFS